MYHLICFVSIFFQKNDKTTRGSEILRYHVELVTYFNLYNIFNIIMTQRTCFVISDEFLVKLVKYKNSSLKKKTCHILILCILHIIFTYVWKLFEFEFNR